MSRYSPTVLPSGVSVAGEILNNLANGYEEGSDKRRKQRREDQAAQQGKDLFDLNFFTQGGRYGTAPGAPAAKAPGAAGSTTLDQGPPLETPPAADVADLMPPDEINTTGDMGDTRPPATTGVDVAQLPQVLSQGRPAPAAPPPGAFQPGIGFYGVTPRRPKFEQIRPEAPGQRGMYFDAEESPRGEAARDREAQLKAAADYRRGDINARGDQARSLEDEKQKGRMAVRKAIADAGITAIGKRGEVQATNQAAHDARTGPAAKAAAGGGSKAATQGQVQANAMKWADGVIRTVRGDYAAAVDWLENTDDGRDAAKEGLKRWHLYQALGKYEQGDVNSSVRLQTGPAMMKPGEAGKAIKDTRAETPRTGPAEAENAAKAAWSKANPPAAGESREQYKQRYEASKKKR